MRRILNPSHIADYLLFLKAKNLPGFRCHGHEIEVPDEYAGLLGESPIAQEDGMYRPIKGLFDYQRDISRLAIRKRKFALFVKCGRGKTLILLEYMRHVAKVLPPDKRLLMVAPLMVVKQTIRECEKWYGKRLLIERIESNRLGGWLRGEGDARLGITNYDGLSEDLEQGCLGALIPDESSTMKSAYGVWGNVLVKLGNGLAWKLCSTGTPAPNDRIEFGTHSVFLDAFPTVNAFLARYFVNRGQSDNRWELKPHALSPFYRDLSRWCIFVENPATYGWKDNCENIPPIHVHIHDVDLTDAQREAVYNLTGKLFLDSPGGITKRAKLSRIGKGDFNGHNGSTNKDAFIKSLVDSWPDESTIIWCEFNNEQDKMERLFPGAAKIRGETPMAERESELEAFQEGRKRIMISKPSVLGFGLNLQICTRQVFSGLRDSYEKFYQAVHRSNRVGSTRPLNVHLPCTEIERPMLENVLRKAARVQSDTEEQECIFKENGVIQW